MEPMFRCFWQAVVELLPDLLTVQAFHKGVHYSRNETILDRRLPAYCRL